LQYSLCFPRDVFFLLLFDRKFFFFIELFRDFFFCFFAPDPPPPPPLQPPKDITLLMASPLKRKGNKFPYGILNQSIIATITETFSYL